MKTLRIGSRESSLAVAQAELVMQAIRISHPEIRTELVTMKTTGDKILDRSLDEIGGKGLFVKELDEALLSGKVDLCVHSYKDMPTEENPSLPVVAVSKREDARDTLVLPNGTLKPDFTRPIGCSSLRRSVQIRQILPEWEISPVRGNVLTRLDKLDNGAFSALALACAGLKRLGLFSRAYRVFDPDEVLPAACQGILAVQMRAEEDFSFLKAFHDQDTWDCAVAERAFIKALNGGCSAPVAAYAVTAKDQITLRGMYADENGSLRKGCLTGSRKDTERMGKELAEKLRAV